MVARVIRLLYLILWVLVFSELPPVQHVAGAIQLDDCVSNGEALTPPQQGAVSKHPDWVITLPWESGVEHKVKNGYGTGEHQKNERGGSDDRHALDFDLSRNEPVYPIAAGTVEYAGEATRGWSGYGTIVFIDHGNGYQSLYAHLESIEPRIAEKEVTEVTRQTKLGDAGQSGTNTVHLHFALYQGAKMQIEPAGIGPKGGVAVVPEPFTGIQDYLGILPNQCMTAQAVGNLTGLVMAASGAPVRDVVVEFVRESVTRVTKTSEDGRYQFMGIPEGVAMITASKRGFGRKSVEVTVAGDTEADIVFGPPTLPLLPEPRPVPIPTPPPIPDLPTLWEQFWQEVIGALIVISLLLMIFQYIITGGKMN